MIDLIVIFTLIVGFIGVLYILFKPSAQPPRKPSEVVKEEEKVVPEKAVEKAPAPQKEPPKPAPKPSKMPLLSKLTGFSSDIVDLSLQYDLDHNLIVSIAEANKFFLYHFTESFDKPMKRYMNISGGTITSIDLTNTKVGISIGRNIKLFSYSIEKEIAIKDLQSLPTEGSHLGPIDYLRATGVSGQFASCTCDNTDDVRIWNCQGASAQIQEVHRIGQLGNLGLVTAKSSQLLVVPGKSPELRVYKAKETANKKGEFIEKTWVVKIPGKESKSAAISDDGVLLVATDGKQIQGWKLDKEQQKTDVMVTFKSDEEVLALDAIRPVNEDNYHDAYAVVAYITGTELRVAAFKEHAKEFTKIDEDTVWEAHGTKIKLVRLAVVKGRVVAMTVAHDKCVKIWELPKGWLPKCSLMWSS